MAKKSDESSDHSLLALINSFSAATFLLDGQLHVGISNHRFSDIFNSNPEKLFGIKITDLIRFHDKPEELQQKISDFSGDKRGFISVNGTINDKTNETNGSGILMVIQKLVTHPDKYICFMEIAGKAPDLLRPDVTDQHLFKLLLQELPDAIYFKDMLGRFFLTNRLHIKKLGLKNVEEFIGKTDFDLFSGDHATRAWEDEQYVIKTGETISKEERETRLDGTETWASTSKMPLRNESGKIVGTFGISKDITQIKQAELQLREAEKILQETNASKDKFFSILAHDLKNPFNSLIGLSDLLVDEFADLTDDEKLDMLSKIRRTSESAYALLENLLDWSRVQAGAIKFNPEKLLLKPVIDEVLALNQLHAYNKKISLQSVVDNKVSVIADENMMRTALRNLVSNAVKFTNPGGKIRVVVKQSDEYIDISVEDNGVGMDDKTREKLFRISEKVKSYGTADESGTGLGLIIVREFLEKNDGKILVESEEGKGSVFTIRLPHHGDEEA